MTRLTNEIREKIINNAVKKAGIPKLFSDLNERRAIWIEEVRLYAVGGKESSEELVKQETKVRAMHAKLPKDLRTDCNSCLLVRHRSNVRLNVAGYSITEVYGDSKPSPTNIVIHADNPLADRFHQLENEKKDIESKQKDIENNVRAVIGQFNTVPQLLKVWKEAEELLPEFAVKSKSNLPSVLIGDLNALVGLVAVQP